MGAVSIISHDPQWALARLRSYASLVQVSGEIDLAGLPLQRGFETAKRALDARLGINCPLCIEHNECRLDWSTNEVEGTTKSDGQTCLFTPYEKLVEFPPIGQECRLRVENGSNRVIVLDTSESLIRIARAPSRVDRREFERTRVEGLAVVHLPTGDSTASIFDISEGGVGLSSPFIVEIGSSVKILLKLEGKRKIPFECEGVVTSCRQVFQNEFGQHRVGIRFSSLPESIRDEIRSFASHD